MTPRHTRSRLLQDLRSRLVRCGKLGKSQISSLSRRYWNDRCTFRIGKQIRSKVREYYSCIMQVVRSTEYKLTVKIGTQPPQYIKSRAQPCSKFSVSQIEAKSGAGTAAERDFRGRIRSAHCFFDRAPRQGNHGTQVQFHGTQLRIVMEYISGSGMCVYHIDCRVW